MDSSAANPATNPPAENLAPTQASAKPATVQKKNTPQHAAGDGGHVASIPNAHHKGNHQSRKAVDPLDLKSAQLDRDLLAANLELKKAKLIAVKQETLNVMTGATATSAPAFGPCRYGAGCTSSACPWKHPQKMAAQPAQPAAKAAKPAAKAAVPRDCPTFPCYTDGCPHNHTGTPAQKAHEAQQAQQALLNENIKLKQQLAAAQPPTAVQEQVQPAAKQELPAAAVQPSAKQEQSAATQQQSIGVLTVVGIVVIVFATVVAAMYSSKFFSKFF